MVLTTQEKYKAVLENVEDFDGMFYYAVKTTGIYCKPSCKSKMPKKENTVFFDSASEAEGAGFKPCKRCRSDLYKFEPAKEIANRVKNALDTMFLEQVKLNKELGKIGLSQRRMVEIFKKEYGLTPKGYADCLRLEEAKKQLTETDNAIIDISLCLGFSSLSAFYKFFKENTGCTPKEYKSGGQK